MPTSVQYHLERCRALQEKWLQVLHQEPPRDDHDDDEDEEDEDEDEDEEEELDDDHAHREPGAHDRTFR
jgi:hypothetical protein